MNQDLTADILNVLRQRPLSRRTLMTASLAAGFALAVQPVTAATISTPDEGLEAGEVSVNVGDEKIPAYRALPKGDGPFPTVLVVQEIFGVHEHIRDICRRFARAGYYAIAPELYARQGDVSGLSNFDEIRKVVAQVPDAQVMSDLDACVEFAKRSGKADVARLGVTGFCWGGRIVWLYAAHSRQLKAGVAWYGRLVGESSELTPKHPVDVAAQLKAPVLGLYAGEDSGIPLDTVEQMRTALKSADATSRIDVYPGAQHGFYADYRPSYSEADARDAWNKLLAWFKEHGAA